MTDIQISETILRDLERVVQYFQTPTGDPFKDQWNALALTMFSSPDSSGIQEKVLSDACGAVHKGGQKLGDDAVWGETPLEIKPCKSVKAVSAVNITDDTPSRLLKDLAVPTKLVVIGRCPGGRAFRWVVVCPLSDFNPSRYRAMCKHWKHEEEPWPEGAEEQRLVVTRLAEKRTETGTYLRSSRLNFADIRTVRAIWVHPDVERSSLLRRAEDALILRFAGK
jgi:hypothetical protein